MKKLMIAAAAVAGFAAAPALAGDLEAHCESYAAENDGDASGCACLAAAADDAMTAELMAVESDADVEALSEASLEAIASCWPDAA